MQVVDKKNIEERILFYCSKMYAQSITAGTDYIDLEKSIAILISNYELESLKEIKKYVWEKFIINPKVIDMSNEEVKKAKKVLDELSQDD